MGCDVRVQTGAAISMMLQMDAVLKIDPDSQFETEADQATEDRFGSSVPADPKDLTKEVERLKGNQEALMETFIEASPGAAAESPNLAGAAGKGLVGGIAGGLMGSLFGPGGTIAGLAIGTAGSITSDVSKEGMDWLMDNRPGSSALELEARIESLEQRLAELQNEKFGHGGDHASIEW